MSEVKINPSYTGPRNDLLTLVPASGRRVLDLGCSTGSFGEALKNRQGAFVFGVEQDPVAAAQALKRLDKVVVGDLESDHVKGSLTGENFDVIVCGDVLEHLKDPWSMLSYLVQKAAAENAVVIVSLPNVGHWSTLYNLLFKQRWPLNDRGIHDRTHLRWFTVKDACRLLEQSGLNIEKVHKNTRLIEAIHPWNGGRAERLLHALFGNLLVHQVLVVGRKKADP